jgi:hypothetical protein
MRTNGDCCFNHIIGLPQKDGQNKALYDYEKIIFDSLATQNGNSNSSNKKHLWIKKATGLGISEFMLRFMAWLCLKDNTLSGSQMCIVTGPRIDLAIALIDRMKKLFAGKYLIIFDSSQAEIARELQVSKASISLDMQYLRNQAKESIWEYVTEHLPTQYQVWDMGYFAVCHDTENNSFGIWESNESGK